MKLLKFISLIFISSFILCSCQTSQDKIPTNPNWNPPIVEADNMKSASKLISENDLWNAMAVIERVKQKTIIQADVDPVEIPIQDFVIRSLEKRDIKVIEKDKLLFASNQNINIQEKDNSPEILKFLNELDSQTATVVYVINEGVYGSFILSSGHINYIDLGAPKELVEKYVISIRSSLTKNLIQIDPMVIDGLASLYHILFKPLEEYLENKKNIIIIPAGAMQLLPLQMLIKDVNHAPNPHFLLYDYNFVYSNSLNTVMRSFIQKARPFSLLVVGPPENTNFESQSIELPNAVRESIFVHNLFPGSTFLVGDNALEYDLKRTLNKYTLIHIATHGFIYPEKPEASFLLTANDRNDDGLLTLEEISKLNLDADLVVLSACETALVAGKIPDNNSSASIAMAFLFGGSDAVISSLWQVDDKATSRLMKYFYTNYGSIELGEAFRKAQISLIETKEYQHPYFWAPFILYGKFI